MIKISNNSKKRAKIIIKVVQKIYQRNMKIKTFKISKQFQMTNMLLNVNNARSQIFLTTGIAVIVAYLMYILDQVLR